MIDTEAIKNNILDICSSNNKAKDVLLKVNGKRDYLEIAEMVGIHPTKCSSILAKAKTYGLLTKDGNYKKTKVFKSFNINKIIRDNTKTVSKEKSFTVKKQRKAISTTKIKQSITNFIMYNFTIIKHPFSGKIHNISSTDLKKASERLIELLDKKIDFEQLQGLPTRFYEAFANYFSCDRIVKSQMLNPFSSLVKQFEPYVKKVAFIKTNDEKLARSSLNNDLIKRVIKFDSTLNNATNEYWNDKPISESCVRFVFPFRHKEAHESHDYPIYEIEKIIYYMFAAIIYINLDAEIIK